MNIFFTSDTHFWHKNILKYCSVSRQNIQNVEEMNEKLIANWNSRISPVDVVYHLGDFGFGNVNKSVEIASRLNGYKHLIIGNHDYMVAKNNSFIAAGCWEIHPKIYNIKVGDVSIVLCHFPIYSWENKQKNAIHLHGHTHGTVSYDDNAFDVGIDARPENDMMPWEFSELREYMKNNSFSVRKVVPMRFD